MRKIAHVGMDAMASLPEDSKRWLWIGLLIVATVAFSLVFACATPFAALATLAALKMSRRDAVVLTGAVWVVNQAVGFGILHYPQTADTFAWAGYMGLGAAFALIAAWLAAWGVGRAMRSDSLVKTAVAFVAAFAAYHVALYPASLTLAGGAHTYSWEVLRPVMETNAVAIVGLLLLQRAAVAIGLAMGESAGAVTRAA